MTTFDQVLRLARELPLIEQARLRAALLQAEETARIEQIAHNQAAIAMLDSWSAADEADDGDVPWDTMLKALDEDREAPRRLYPHLHDDEVEHTS